MWLSCVKLQRVELSYFQAFYERSRKRLLIFDYDGTLVPYHSLPQVQPLPFPSQRKQAPPSGASHVVLSCLLCVYMCAAGGSECRGGEFVGGAV